MRKLTIKDFDNSREFEAYKRDMRKADQNKRVSSTGRKGFMMQGGDE